MNHHPCSPSTLYRRQLCPGSLALEDGLPDTGGDDAEHGMMCHNLVYALLDGDIATAETITDVVGQDSLDAAEWCVKQIGKLGYEKTAWEHERRLQLYRGFDEVTWGTADLILVDPETGTAYLIDLKFGRIPVSTPEANLQTASYGAALMQEEPSIEEVRVYIYQPFVSQRKPEEYIITKPDAVAAYVGNIIDECERAKQLANDSENVDEWAETFLHPSPSACRYCKAKPNCRAVKNLQDELVAWDNTLPVSEEERIVLWDKVDIVDRKLKEIRKRIQQEVMNDAIEGKESYGFKVIERQGTAKTNIRELATDLQSWFTTSELLEHCTAKITSLRNEFVKKAVATGKAETKKEAKQLFDAETQNSIIRGEPSSHVERDKSVTVEAERARR